MKTRSKQETAVLIAVVLMSTLAASAQLKGYTTTPNQTQSDWRVYSPPDKSFTVELPGEPHQTNKLDPSSSDENEKSFFECTKSIKGYVLPLWPTHPANVFVIGVFDVSGCKRKPELFDEEVKGLVTLIGGDDKSLISDSATRANDLPGREFIYENGDRYGRVLIVNAGRRIYLLSYTTDVRGATTSPEAIRMFSSFRPVRNAA
jgi:hypothetical protein